MASKGIEFKDTRMALDGSHLKLKAEGKSEFGGLPCICIDGEWFGQNKAILRMLGTRLNMYPTNPKQQWRCDAVMDYMFDELD